VTIGDRVYTSPHSQIIALNHVFDDPDRPLIEQGVTAEGIVVEDDVWLGSGAIVTDGVVTEVVPPHTVVGGVPARGRWAARSRAPGEVASSCCTAHGKSRSVCAALDGLQELPFQLQQDETKFIFNYRR